MVNPKKFKQRQAESKVEKTKYTHFYFSYCYYFLKTLLLEIVKYFRNSLSDIEKLPLHPTFSTYLQKYSFSSEEQGFTRDVSG